MIYRLPMPPDVDLAHELDELPGVICLVRTHTQRFPSSLPPVFPPPIPEVRPVLAYVPSKSLAIEYRIASTVLRMARKGWSCGTRSSRDA